MEVSPLSASFGAKVTGIDLKSDIADNDVEALKRALLEHKLLLFQGEVLAPEEQVRFSARFGELVSFRRIQQVRRTPRNLSRFKCRFARFHRGWTILAR